MKKIIGLLAGFLVLSLFVGLTWVLYRHFGSTPIVILNVFIVMIGLLLAMLVFTRISKFQVNQKRKDNILHYPSIELGKILVKPADFCMKLESLRGNIYLISTDKIIQSIQLKNGEYNKIKDELTLHFSDGVKTKFRGVKHISVGDYQFMVYDFEEMLHTDGKKDYYFILEGRNLSEKQGSNTIQHRIPRGKPIYLFDWRKN
ncbi:MAG: hypothetical protein H3C31_01165 [Brumimicrobium sp.]|nr:hypothetical protein [Brumimicrobium sp.]MCO5269340.1 hypothetical protein [Brumimicrobium sp.]